MRMMMRMMKIDKYDGENEYHLVTKKNTHLLMPLTMYDNDDENFDQDNDEHDEND